MSNLEKEILRFLSTVEKASSDKIVMSLSRPLDRRVLTTLLARLEKFGKIHREFESERGVERKELSADSSFLSGYK